ncbi:cell envelope-related function transcriptional attenuator common domain-containing protein [Amycolatopsis pretoriensis]|uniref:Cell envelope-related function transcriptional attenuator common domain-containing protein n=1 Tax=Amycolatopsis pretoriensis TaxID=218821 RepID=A0A1H5R3R2_9PSEU|nr:LCP family protein [Amycolatopsis pretoriensis]SEF33036.1 cell envelope-related function transcriptional attenuator common domain-containing protein [Amycolatopsis pretoriensis]
MQLLGKIAVAGLAFTVLCGTAYGYANLHALDEVTRDSVIGDGAAAAGERPADGSLDILLVGRDSRTDQQEHPLPADVLRELRAGANGDDLTDTLIVLRIPNGTHDVKAFSIPRDSYVSMPGGKGKINAAFGRAKAAEAKRQRDAGETDKAKVTKAALTAGRRGTRQAVEDLTGVEIDHYAEVNLLSFYEISKAIGGVDVCLKEATKDKNSGADFPAGPQRIQGAEALAFVRQRDGLPGTDFARVRRQQVFLAGLARQVLSAGTLTNPGKLSDLIDAVKRSVVLDDSWQLLDFVAQMRGVSGGGIRFETIPVVNRDYRYDPDKPTATAVQVDPAAVKSFAANLIGSPPPSTPAAPVTVDVTNASPKGGLAARVSGFLGEHGFAKGVTGNADARRTSLVRFGADLAQRGAEVAKLLGGLSTQESAAVPPGHIEVVLGTVYSGPGTTGGGGAPAAGDEPITSDGVVCVN